MNFIAGYIIIITKDEEKSFWLMDALLGTILPGGSSFRNAHNHITSIDKLINNLYETDSKVREHE